jgi:hypothetical protein
MYPLPGDGKPRLVTLFLPYQGQLVRKGNCPVHAGGENMYPLFPPHRESSCFNSPVHTGREYVSPPRIGNQVAFLPPLRRLSMLRPALSLCLGTP